MNRKIFLKNLLLQSNRLNLKNRRAPEGVLDYDIPEKILKSDFGSNFLWGVSASSFQSEGAYNIDGKGISIWDKFSHEKGKIKSAEHAHIACDFYNNYAEDINHIKSLNFNVYRFSLSWSRILPEGTGKINEKGIEFYHRVIDHCIHSDLIPYVTLYHWDLPQILEKKGGWTNREIINWFSEYVQVCVKEYGDKVNNWMILNEPLSFTGLGYMMGMHAPGRKGIKNFLPAVHHAALCQAEGGRIIRQLYPKANIGTTFSCSFVDPINSRKKNLKAARKIDAILNRLFIEPALGLGYPVNELSFLKSIKKYFKPGDEEKLKFDFDFIGIQNYTRIIAKFSFSMIPLFVKVVSPKTMDVTLNEMKWEVYPEGIYRILKQFGSYKGIKKIIITENGVCFPDVLNDGKINDQQRIQFFKEYLAYVLKAKNEGVKIDGYFVWSATDNFEWAEGYNPRFGLIYIDYVTQKRYIKDSGFWFKDFLK